MHRANRTILGVSTTFVVAAALLSPVAAHAAPSTAAGVLTELTVTAEDTAPYSRAEFPHWIDEDGDGCNTRYEVLIEESTTPVTVGTGCSLTGGSWYSYFDDIAWEDPSDVDIDHLVPLAEAWRSGAAAWTTDQRRAFANDLGFSGSLVAVTDSVNQSKSDRDPAAWLPPHEPAQCRYATEWVLVKYRWNLSIDAAEHAALQSLLSGDCGNTEVNLPAVEGPALQHAITTPPVPAESTVPVYRFWSAAYNGHFYTASLSERDKLILNYPDNVWKYEGVDYGAYTTQVEGTVPLYRFWSATYNGHFYTTSAAERNKIIATYPTHVWQPEGIAYYVYPKNTQVAPTKPVARFWSATYMHHFYTADAGEATKVKNNYPAHIWKYETDDFRVPTTKPAAAPLPTPAAPTPQPGIPTNPGDSKNCGDFTTWAAANAWFQTYFPYYGDIAKLDGDGNGIPCESLPGAPK